MTATQVHETISEETVREISDELGEPDWLLETRLDALDALGELEMPDVIRTPGRDWTNLDALDYESFVDPLNAAEEKDQVGPDEAEVLPLAAAIDEREDLLKEHFGSVIDPQENYLTALSTALFSTGTLVYVPENVDAEDVTIRTTQHSQSLFNYTLVVTEQSSSVTILERQDTGEDIEGDRYYSGIVEVAAGENSHIQYGSLQDLDEETYNYTLKRGEAADYATVNWVEGNIGSRLTKSSVETNLDGEGSETKTVGAFFGHDDQHFDIAARVWHNTAHTTADLVTRGVLDDDARSVYEGVQDVGRDAWDTNSYQRENTLMLSDESEADASPKLIINNHDTEASHSATVGQIDEEDMFYMTSRSLDDESARNMLVEGFFVPVFEEVEVEELREDLELRVQERLRE
ncbi:Fe-S cluster assembly protein SufD [Halorussus gelatinilyticus]|uniref:Fe-S cluster assembly protein SufD n=1 Tax=Halorussus gelatinilyticus TaxID=2937524 RepID=A0A8U0IF71_9EURY|nr:Fe-S cluster assembly protein SufD [Halorussus gelatinilyticus]UPV99394.1 Fe-S cluster assembly protein SufD [Halorussus gelatinilyticus]